MQSRLLLYFLTTHAFKISTPRPLCAKEAHAVQSGQALQTVLKNRQCVQAGCGNVQDGIIACSKSSFPMEDRFVCAPPFS